jgi:pimeloyl-ACP methyl ester carboxylesterase
VLQAHVQKLDPREEHYWIEGPRKGLQLFLRHLPPGEREPAMMRPVVYVHGATFPSALSIAHRFDGYSWRDALCDAGFDVWGFDFLGYGYSDRYPEMNEPYAARKMRPSNWKRSCVSFFSGTACQAFRS